MNRTRSVDSSGADESPEVTVETVSPTASDVGSMSDSPAKVAAQPQKKKKRGLSFKKIRNNAQKLIPGRKKEKGGSEEVPEVVPQAPESPPPTPVLKEMKSTESLPAIKEEAKEVLQSTKSIEEIPKVKKARKPSRAASFVKKLAGRKAKVAPNPPKGDDEASGSTTETPLSIKRRTPEGANLSVSETSLYEGDKPSDSFKIEQLDSEPKVVRTISPKKTEMKITLINNAEGTSSSTAAATARASGGDGVQLPPATASASLGTSSSSSLATSSSTSSPTTNVDKAAASVASVGETKSDALLPSSTTLTGTSKPISGSAITTAIDQELTISSLLAGDYNRFSIDKVADDPPTSPREKFFQPLIDAVTPSQDQQDTAVETIEVNDNVVTVTTPPEDPTPPTPQSPTQAGKLKNIFMKKDAQKKAKSAAAKAAAAAAAASSAAASTSSEGTSAQDPKPATVRTQEAAKPYQLGNNIKNPNLPSFKSPPPQESPPPPAETIVFNIGSSVRPDRTGSAKKPTTTTTTLIPPSLEGNAPSSGNFNQSKSLEEYTSAGPDSSPLSSENSRRRIAYVAQPTEFTPEEEELVSGRPSLLSSVAGSSSLEESADFLESSGGAGGGNKMSPHGDLLLEKGGEQVVSIEGGNKEKRG